MEAGNLYDIYYRKVDSKTIASGDILLFSQIMEKDSSEIEALLENSPQGFCIKEKVNSDTVKAVSSKLTAQSIPYTININWLDNKDRNKWILTMEKMSTSDKLKIIMIIRNLANNSVLEAKVITENPGSIILETDDGQRVYEIKEKIEAFGVTVKLIQPTEVFIKQRGILVLRSSTKRQETYNKLANMLNTNDSQERNKILDTVPNGYIMNSYEKIYAEEIIKNFRKINAELEFIDGFGLNLTSFGANKDDVLRLISEANFFDSGDSTLIPKLDTLITDLPTLVLSSIDYDKILNLKTKIEEAGGTAEIENACNVTVEKDEDNIIRSVPKAVIKGTGLEICFAAGYHPFGEYKLYINDERISDGVKYIGNNSYCYQTHGVSGDYKIRIEPKERVEVYGLDDSIEFIYNGKPHDLTKLMSFSNPNITLDDWYMEYEEEIQLESGDFDYNYYEPDNPPIEAGFYYFYGWLEDTEEYLGAFDYYFTIQKKDLTVKPKDISVIVNDDFDFETEYIGIVSGDVVSPSGEFEYVIYAEDDVNSKSPTPIPKEEAIKKAGTYIISYLNDASSLFKEKNYNIIIKDATLTVENKPSTGSSATYYTITVIENENVVIEPSEKVRVKRGNNQKFSFKANDRYEISDVLIDGESFGALTEYTFEKVKSKHTVEVVVKEKTTEKESFYEDVKEDDWFYKMVKDITDIGIMNGTGDNKFSPYVGTTRGMIITILYRLEGKVEVTKKSTFTDVEDKMWYTDAISFGEQNGIILGYGDGRFGPNDIITREQLSAIMYRYAKYKGYDVSIGEDTNILSYNDISDLAEYAIPAMQWACGEELIKGMDNNMLSPKGNATRAQVATILMRFCERYVK